MSTTARGTTLVWATLMIATLASFGVAEYFSKPSIAAVVILSVAAFKVRMILRHFMELKDGPLAWRVFFDAWTAGCALMIAGLCWYASG